ncbi:hypothetical protein GCM10018793_67150 [Streptomyces sulfonofaciens]|uniref:Carrier domain-containing protein n=1 Tax=Streptomyces sulfonofaciens TaxID=68272 RepID=A0A919GP89_9ACTN|nr:hypothetical protein GCM10018793_67150 [Streptomyces sulfonofaciens]
MFLEDGERHESRIGYAELDRRARRTAGRLLASGAAGRPALLLFPPGLDYISAFFGCLYAGVAAVPAYPPQGERGLRRLSAVVADAGAAVALTTQGLLSLAGPLLDPGLRWLAVDTPGTGADAESPGPGQDATGALPAVQPGDLAFLQYTSGSTRDPRGVMLTHVQLMHNLGLMHRWFEGTTGNVAVSWLPPYHDMGLIGSILEPLHGGFPAVLMSPLHFLEKPHRWLSALSRHRGTVSAAPNFAYELCLRKTTPEQRAALDLSSWRVAVNGAEPVRAETLERFTRAFAVAGFRRETFRPSYGLAEATLLVTADAAGLPPALVELDGTTRVACGPVIGDQHLVVVDTASLEPAERGRTGEVWLSGPSVAEGYWGRPTETEALFGARLPGDERRYLRTGDLGCLDEAGRLVVTGRIKDLIVLRGRNVHPQDVELAAEQSHPAARPGCGAAFSVPVGDEEGLVLVQEVTAGADADEVAVAVRRALREECEVDVHELVLIEARGIPKTSSGKIQRRATRAAYLEGTLKKVAAWRAGDGTPGGYAPPRTPVEELIAGIWAELLGVERVGVHDEFFASGGQSLLLTRLVARIRAELPVRIELGDVFEAPTVAALAALIGERPLAADPDRVRELFADLETN